MLQLENQSNYSEKKEDKSPLSSLTSNYSSPSKKLSENFLTKLNKTLKAQDVNADKEIKLDNKVEVRAKVPSRHAASSKHVT